MRRSKRSSIAGQPVLVGALTVFAAVIATYLAYGANDGLPFVPTYDIVVEAPDAGHLFKDADVRMAGVRIGHLASVETVQHPDGSTTARLHLSLDKVARPLPADTRFAFQPRSYAGSEFVEVRRGHARASLRNGTVVPLRRFVRTVSFDDTLSTYTAPVRRGMRQELRGLASGLAARGPGLNQALGDLDVLLGHLTPAARLLRLPGTHLTRLIGGLARLSGEVAPVAFEQANGFTELNATFSALSRSAPNLAHLIEAAPRSEQAVVRDAPAIDAYLRSSRRLTAALAPAARELKPSSRVIAAALLAAPRGLPATRRTLPRAEEMARALGVFATAPQVIPAIDRLSLFGRTLAPLVSFLAPAETRCRYASLLVRNLASALHEGPQSGAALRVVLVAVSAASNSEAVLASAPSANKDAVALGELHSNPYPYTASPGQPRSCAAGQENYRRGHIDIGNPRPAPDAVTEAP